jgi:hypothetical protein
MERREALERSVSSEVQLLRVEIEERKEWDGEPGSQKVATNI